MALILPFSREIGATTLTKISTKIAGREDETGELLANYLAITYHMVFLSVAVGSPVTNITIYILLGIDHCINFYHVISTFRTKRNPTNTSTEKLIKSIQILIVSESLEVIIPLAYLLCFIPAYYGPNSEILGNVKNSYWQYSSVDDIWGAISNLLFWS